MDTSIEPDMLPFLRISCFRKGNAAVGGSSGTVTVYDCRMLGMLAEERSQRPGASYAGGGEGFLCSALFYQDVSLRFPWSLSFIHSVMEQQQPHKSRRIEDL